MAHSSWEAANGSAAKLFLLVTVLSALLCGAVPKGWQGGWRSIFKWGGITKSTHCSRLFLPEKYLKMWRGIKPRNPVELKPLSLAAVCCTCTAEHACTEPSMKSIPALRGREQWLGRLKAFPGFLTCGFSASCCTLNSFHRSCLLAGSQILPEVFSWGFLPKTITPFPKLEYTGLVFRKFCVPSLQMLVFKHISAICTIPSGSVSALEFLTTVHFCHLSCSHIFLIGFQIAFSLAVIHKEYRDKYA